MFSKDLPSSILGLAFVLFTLTLCRSAHSTARCAAQVRCALYGCDCYAYGLLAAGHCDLVAEADMKPYDYLALVPVVAGAGGRITSWSVRARAWLSQNQAWHLHAGRPQRWRGGRDSTPQASSCCSGGAVAGCAHQSAVSRRPAYGGEHVRHALPEPPCLLATGPLAMQCWSDGAVVLQHRGSA